MQKYKTIEDYFIKNDILAMQKEIFKLFCINEYQEDVNIKCIDAFMETPLYLLETGVSFFIKEKMYFEHKTNGKAQREYCYEYSYGASSPEDWIPDVYYSFVD